MTRRKPKGIHPSVLLAGGLHSRRAPQPDTPNPDDQIAAIYRERGLKLVLGRLGVDFAVGTYEWQGRKRRIVCSGTFRGSDYDTKLAALRHLQGGEQAPVIECDWCGTEIPGLPFRDRIGGNFCSRSHRDQSTAAVKRLRDVKS